MKENDKKNMTHQDPVPYLHELTENPNYELKPLVSRDYQVTNPNDYHATYHLIFYDKKQKNLIVESKKESRTKGDTQYEIKKINSAGQIISKVSPIGHIINNGIAITRAEYSTWILNNDTTYHKLEPLLTEKENKDKAKWFPKFKDAYMQADYVYLPTSFDDYHMLVDDTWYLMEYGLEDQQYDIIERYPAKNPPGRMIALEDVTPDFFTDPSERDTSLIKVLGYGQEYFEEGAGANPINGSAGHYYIQLNMQKDTLRFKRFGTMGAQLTVYKISEALGGHPDVVFIVQTRNAMFPNREFGGMYVVRPRELEKDQFSR